MSLDIDLIMTKPVSVFELNITHNLTEMADKAGIYKAMWRPEELKITRAKQLIPLLEKGLKKLISKPEYYKKFNPPNGWGTYDNFVQVVEEYLQACKDNPKAKLEVSR